jgi:hypothetical protein
MSGGREMRRITAAYMSKDSINWSPEAKIYVYVYVCIYIYTHTHTHTHTKGQICKEITRNSRFAGKYMCIA